MRSLNGYLEFVLPRPTGYRVSAFRLTAEELTELEAHAERARALYGLPVKPLTLYGFPVKPRRS